ncbi:chemotaxis protein CheD [Methylomonas sp. SURF-2]|uniref:Probable chemoreceptor glutamine deamidase CheD n=1 Tax=Methylomonas subterranea TaxID=2952225 RepID=A0ABT1TET5_9GAMM|nr:chemotaxis protein CheD [Methylomonas sp. SURF-2]MCQ8103977.1 chemotaxis protein CheD [Methylomonas sp. SURF-2]
MASHFHKPDFFIEIFLQPGEFYFGDRDTRIRSLLGSCVAITLWHPRLKIGGMCHYMLTTHHGNKPKTELDGRYADDAMVLFMRELDNSGTWPRDYEVKMFGGGNMFPAHGKIGPISVPENNIHYGRGILIRHGFRIKAGHLGSSGHRNIIFDIWSGNVWVQHVAKS